MARRHLKVAHSESEDRRTLDCDQRRSAVAAEPEPGTWRLTDRGVVNET